MSSDVKTIPLIIQTPSDDSPNCSTGCGKCGSTGCAGGLGVKAGSEKDVVYRNLFIFAVIIIVMIVASFLIMKILNAILE
ncbi:MAG: hypothetical protein P1P69_03140 [Methanosarcinaceae archaeon]|nr:hypothetical protein [Methanosarcinaceae archaeon]MDF1533481.1 hypothetical protein [Methanosarcinaceae archaeon]